MAGPVSAELVALANSLADAARPIAARYFRTPVTVDDKADQSPVTIADREAETAMRVLLEKHVPQHGVFGEEHGAVRTDAEYVWVLDPIDGTKSFITGVPLWGTLIALLHRGRPVLGCIHQPVLGQLMLGDETGTTLNGLPVRCRPTTSLAEATLLTSDPLNPARHQDGAGYERVLRAARLGRTWGDCYGYLLVASGRADVMLDPIMNPWDIAALVPVIRGAGGVITDWQGGEPYPAQSTIACATPELHAAVLRTLKG